MKYMYYVLLVIALLLVVYNVTLLDFAHPFQGDSLVALIGVISSLCAILIIFIFQQSKKINDRVNKQ